MEYLDLLAENAQNWDTTGTYEAPGKTQPHTSSGGMYNLTEDHDLQAKFASLARKVEALEFKKNGQIKSVQDLLARMSRTSNLVFNQIECIICDKLDLMRNVVPTNENKRIQRAWRVNTIDS
jgi:hypothetical protein